MISAGDGAQTKVGSWNAHEIMMGGNLFTGTCGPLKALDAIGIKQLVLKITTKEQVFIDKR